MLEAKLVFSGNSLIGRARRPGPAAGGDAARQDRHTGTSGSVMAALLLLAIPTALVAGAAALLGGAGFWQAVLAYVAAGSCAVLAGGWLMTMRPRQEPGGLREAGLHGAPAEGLQNRLFAEATARLAAAREGRRAALVLGARMAETRKLQSWLQELNHNVIACHEPALALGMIGDHPDYFEYVLIDAARLGDTETRAFCIELRGLEPDLPAVVLRAPRPDAATGDRHTAVIDPPKGKTALKLAILSALGKPLAGGGPGPAVVRAGSGGGPVR